MRAKQTPLPAEDPRPGPGATPYFRPVGIFSRPRPPGPGPRGGARGRPSRASTDFAADVRGDALDDVLEVEVLRTTALSPSSREIENSVESITGLGRPGISSNPSTLPKSNSRSFSMILEPLILAS